MRANRAAILQQLLQVLLVGMALGLTRTVVPALAEDEFGVARGSFLLLASFVIAFGLVKGVMNFVAGRVAEFAGRRRVLIAGWLVAIPIPLLLYFAPNWNWVVVATVLLGINQGLTWSMTQTIKLDLTRPDERGNVIGLNEFSGYLGVAAAGIATAYLAQTLGPRAGLLWFGAAIIGLAILAAFQVRESLPWATASADGDVSAPTTRELFARMSWRDTEFVAVTQAGLVEKFVDALVWILVPVYLYERGVSLPVIGWIVGIYGLTWGALQLVTGRLSDRWGRRGLNVSGMWVCGAGVAMMVAGDGVTWWSASAAVTGIGMAMLYPNLSAAIADLAPAQWRASAIGIYRFWRDIGYAVGAAVIGATAAYTTGVEWAFWLVAAAMFVSGAVLARVGPR